MYPKKDIIIEKLESRGGTLNGDILESGMYWSSTEENEDKAHYQKF
ncbi:hypothetical protein QLS71_013280 [Mariniflexile litorale]|uniref:Uncharacterized protein n=1 Tax=Mariniflexile litorale TaxID=3045158 RepID=A0AAU7ECK8_9FLAO|nr:hypothetical protein [Mariniflexile sp. KMM 9835]MDQ8212169.1 hypothetical protein [Mariniflexile sp. KMM 9835]